MSLGVGETVKNQASMLVINGKKFLIDLIIGIDQLGKRQIFGVCCKGYLYHLKPNSANMVESYHLSIRCKIKSWQLLEKPNFKPVQLFKEQKGLRYGH